MTSPQQDPADPHQPYAPHAPYASAPYGAPVPGAQAGYPGPYYAAPNALHPNAKPTRPPKLSNIARVLAWVTIGLSVALIIVFWVFALTGSIHVYTHVTWLFEIVTWVSRITGVAALVLGIVSLVRQERPVRRAVFGIVALPAMLFLNWAVTVFSVLIGMAIYISTQV